MRAIQLFSAQTMEPLAVPPLLFNPALGFAALRQAVAERLGVNVNGVRMAVARGNALVEADQTLFFRPSLGGPLRLFVLAGSGQHDPNAQLINPATSENRVPFSFSLRSVADALEYARALSGREAGDLDAARRRLAERARLFGLYENPAIDATGHCQFDAVADQLCRHHPWHANETKESVRMRAVEWIRANAARDLGNDLTLREWIEGTLGRNFEAYCEDMGRTRASQGGAVEWGDEVTLLAICEAYQVSILFVASIEGGDAHRMLYPRGRGPDHDIPQLNIGHLHELHYWSLIGFNIDADMTGSSEDGVASGGGAKRGQGRYGAVSGSMLTRQR